MHRCRQRLAEMANVYLKLAEISAKQKNYEASLVTANRHGNSRRTHTRPKFCWRFIALPTAITELALQMLREARDEEPNYPVTPLMLGQMAARQQQWDVAREKLCRRHGTTHSRKLARKPPQTIFDPAHTERFRLAQQLQDIELARDALGKMGASRTRKHQAPRQVRRTADQFSSLERRGPPHAYHVDIWQWRRQIPMIVANH